MTVLRFSKKLMVHHPLIENIENKYILKQYNQKEKETCEYSWPFLGQSYLLLAVSMFTGGIFPCIVTNAR
jgi:hypothetical protein